MEEKTKLQKMVKVGLIISVIALVLSIMLFNFFACTNNNLTYIDMKNANVLQLKEIRSSEDTGDVSETGDVTEVTSSSTVSGTVKAESELDKATPIDPADFVIDIPEGSQIAIIETSLGTLKVRLYPEYAPKTVENFVRLANEGYYDNTYIYRVQPDVYCAGGAAMPDGDNKAKYDIKNERVPSEISPSLWPFRGAMMSLDTYTDNNFFDVLFHKTKTYTGSQFIICGSVEFTDEFIAELKKTTFPDIIKQGFIELGGVPNYSQKLCVFAQTYEGFDVLDKILSVTLSDGETLQPVEDIKIISIKISDYAK